MAEQLSGTVERVTFHSPESGWAVLRVQARGRRGLTTVVGSVASVNAGEFVEATGSWVHDPQHGEQFKADELRCVPPSTIEGIEKYLGSGLVKGIGPVYARKIVAVFRERTLEVIDQSPSFLKEVKGIGAKRIQQIRESWREQRAIREIMVFLQSHGIGTAKAVRIYKTEGYGEKAIEVVSANPYRLATDVWGFGFKSADAIARRMGVDLRSPNRARAALRFVLQEASTEGHVGAPEEGVLRTTAEVMEAASDGAVSIPEELLRDAVEAERKEGEIVVEPKGGEDRNERWLYLKPLFLAELNLARGICKLRQGDHPLPEENLDEAVQRIESRMELELAPAQREAIQAAAREKVLVVTGGPGVGKTTLVRGILEVFAARRCRIALCAPTGRAAKRLTETTGREARTIHRLLEFDPVLGGFKRGTNHPLDADLVVVDECSMVDVPLMHKLVQAIRPHACLVLVGDVDQLPSVGPGLVLNDLIASRVVPVVRLTQVFRQASQSWIVRAAHAIKEGEIPESAPAGGKGDFYFVEAQSPGAILERMLAMVRERIPQRFGLDPVRDVQVLAPMNRNELGVDSLNARLQDALNPGGGKPEVTRFSTRFRAGDKVMQTQNNYTKEVFNGDIGRIASIEEADRQVVVEYDGRPVAYDFGELDEVTLAYACSVHKSQGSEYPAVIIPLHTQHMMMLQRNLLYTGVTRGKKLVVLVGTRPALEMAIRNQDTRRRCSMLRQRLVELAEVGDSRALDL